jgi:hypothetical protein
MSGEGSVAAMPWSDRQMHSDQCVRLVLLRSIFAWQLNVWWTRNMDYDMKTGSNFVVATQGQATDNSLLSKHFGHKFP